MATKKTTDYRLLSQELDTILESLQSADLDIDQAITAYERGMVIVQELEAYLRTAENKINKLQTRFGNTES